MNNNHSKHNHKPQENNRHRFEVVPVVAEINVPAKEDFVKIPVSEYMGLVANNAVLEVVKRIILLDSRTAYVRNETLRTVLNMPVEKEEK